MKRLVSIIMALAVMVLTVSTVAAQDVAPFASTFDAENATALVDVPQVMVAAVGPAAKPAADALSQALRGAKGVTLVMDASPLGDISSKSDDEIFAAAAVYPIQGVVAVRTFPAADNQFVAVLAYRNKDGSVRRSASVMSNQRLDPSQISDSSSQIEVKPVPSETIVDDRSELAQALAKKTDLKAAAIATMKAEELQRGKFNRQYVHFGPEMWEAYQGVFNEPLEGEDFYNAIRDPDLADQYNTWNGLRTGLLVGGGAAAALGGGLLFVGLPNDSNETLVIAGSVALSTAAGAIIWGLLIDPHPISEPEARQKADEFNKSLRRELGVK